MLYQAHRALLWAGDVDYAREIWREVAQSKFRASAKFLMSLRRARAEKRIADARAIYREGIQKFASRPSTVWLSHLLLWEDAKARAVVSGLYDENNLHQIASYLRYSHFDPNPYPALMKILQRENARPRKVSVIPFRCQA